MGTVTDELMGALFACGMFAFIGFTAWALSYDPAFTNTGKSRKFWKWWTAFWLAPIAFHILRIVYLG